MYITSMSPSSYNTSVDCEMKYFFAYLLRMREPSNVKAEIGTVTHNMYEILALHKKANQDGAETIQHPVLGEDPVPAQIAHEVDCDALWDACWDYQLTITECAKGVSEFTQALYDEYKKHAWVVFESQYDPRYLNIVAPEQQMSVEIKEPWAKYSYYSTAREKEIKGYYKINTIIDLIFENEDGSWTFLDWKTGQRKNWTTGKKKEYADLYHDIQLNIYYYLLKDQYPDKDIDVCIYYTKDGGPFTFTFNEESIRGTITRIRERFTYMRSLLKPHQNKSFRCKWCHFYKTSLPDAPAEFRRGKFDDIGEKMCACSHVSLRIEEEGINKVIGDLRIPYKK